jgi:hypothetical protein
MVFPSSLFSQLLSLIPRNEFHRAVRDHRAERGAKGLTSWAHFVSMLFCQFAQAKSLREISDGLRICLGRLAHLNIRKAPPRSTLSYANAHRPWEMFEEVFYQVLEQARLVAPNKKFRFKNKLYSLDSTVVDLCLSLFPWAKFRQKKGAIKLHMLLDHDGYLPVFAHITEGAVHDVNIARLLDLAPDSIVAMDRAYNDYALFSAWTEKQIWFVTRMKRNAAFDVVVEVDVPAHEQILCEQIIRLTGQKAQAQKNRFYRRVVIWDEAKQREIVLLTNHMNFAASTIAAIYKDRWQIELFFKAIKQNLRIKTFVGTTPNALRIQIWTALIAILLLKILQFRARHGWSLSNLVAQLRWNLFTYRDLWAWLDNPFENPPRPPNQEQLPLPIPALGQHARLEGDNHYRGSAKPVRKR